MPNFTKLRKKDNYFDFENAPENNLFQIFVPGSNFDPIFSEVLTLAGFTRQDIETRSAFTSRHVSDHCQKMAHHFNSAIYHVKRMLRNKEVPLERKGKFINQVLNEFGNVQKGLFAADVVYLSSEEEVEKARVAFESASTYAVKGEYGSTIFNGMMDLLNIITNSLKKIESGDFFSIDFIDMVDIALFNTSEAIVELMGDNKYEHRTYHFKIWSAILNESPYLLWLSVNNDGVKRVFSVEEATGVYRMQLESQPKNSAVVRLKRSNIFSELNHVFGTLDIVVPSKKPKKINNRRDYFKKKHQHMMKGAKANTVRIAA